jgi:hypothetical protein
MSADEFATMRARTQFYRSRLQKLDAASRRVVKATVRERIRQHPTAALPTSLAELADEIFALLSEPRLDEVRARMLVREFFDD